MASSENFYYVGEVLSSFESINLSHKRGFMMTKDTCKPYDTITHSYIGVSGATERETLNPELTKLTTTTVISSINE